MTDTISVAAILFDLDGTLIDSTDCVRRQWQRIAPMIGREGEDLPGDLHGIPGAQALQILDPGLSPERAREINAILLDGEINDTEGVVPAKGAVELLATLPTDRWGIVTSGTHALATARIAAAGIPVPDVLITADDVAKGKPDPAPYELGARALGLPTSACLAIEDAPAGITSARAAGCHTLGVLATYPQLDGPTVAELSGISATVTPTGLTISW